MHRCVCFVEGVPSFMSYLQKAGTKRIRVLEKFKLNAFFLVLKTEISVSAKQARESYPSLRKVGAIISRISSSLSIPLLILAIALSTSCFLFSAIFEEVFKV